MHPIHMKLIVFCCLSSFSTSSSFVPCCFSALSDGHQGSVCGPLQCVRRKCHFLLRGSQGVAGRRRPAAGGCHEADPGARSLPGARHLRLRGSLPSFWLRPAHTRQWLPLAGQGRLWDDSRSACVRVKSWCALASTGCSSDNNKLPHCNTFLSIFSPRCEKLLTSTPALISLCLKVGPFVLQIDFMLQIRLDKFLQLQNIYHHCTHCTLSSILIDETSWPSVAAAAHHKWRSLAANECSSVFWPLDFYIFNPPHPHSATRSNL